MVGRVKSLRDPMMKRYQRTAFSQYFLMAFIIVSIVAVGLLSFYVMSRVPFTDHFAIPWAAGRVWLLAGESPYGPTVVDTALDALENSPLMGILPEDQVFSAPLLSLLFYIPFSLMPYTISRILWTMVLVANLCLTGLLSVKISGWKLTTYGKLFVCFILVLWLPGADMVLRGYLSPVIFGLVLAGIYLLLYGQETTAGFILALTFSSFLTSGFVMVLLLIWSISRKQWSILVSYFSGVIFLILLSFLILPSWFMDWASVLLNMNIDLGWINTPLMEMASLLPGIAAPFSLILHSGFAVYAVILLFTIPRTSGKVFIYKTFLFLIFVFLFHVQGSVAQLLLIVPGLLLMLSYWSERWKRFGNLVSWGVLLLIGVGSWLSAQSAIDFIQPLEIPLIFIGLPVFVILGMIYIRWWALMVPKLPFEAL